MINATELRSIFPRCPASMVEIYADRLSEALAEFEINTVTRAAAFLGQVGRESGELQYFEEIADGRDYEGRIDLGNTEPGDGPRYKGRGPIQTTGRLNYRKAGEALGLPLEDDPDLVATAAVGFRASAYYWKSHGLNTLADRCGDYRRITKIVNGAYRAHDRRLAYYRRALEVIGAGVPLLAPLRG